MAEQATVARPYAQAIFDLAKTSKETLDRWGRALGLLAAASRDERIQRAMLTPDATAETKARVLIDVCGDELDDKARNLVRVLSHNKRLDLVGDVAEQFEVLRAEAERILDVEVVSAYPLADAEAQNLAAALKRKFEREITMKSRVDNTLMGGVVIHAGDTVIDGSVRGRLVKLQEALTRP